MDPNERFRARRDQTRRTKRRRRAAVLALLLGRDRRPDGRPVRRRAAHRRNRAAVPARWPHPSPSPPAARGRSRSRSAESTSRAHSPRYPASSRSTSATSASASTRSSWTSRTKAERSGSLPPTCPLARKVGATRRLYNPKALVALAHRNGIYMIGRVVCFQDPKLARDVRISPSSGATGASGRPTPGSAG